MSSWRPKNLAATSLLLTASLLIPADNLPAALVVQAWLQRYNGPGNGTDAACAIAVNRTNGNVYVTGYSVVANYFPAYATIAYSSHGTPLWTNFYIGPARNDAANAIAVDSSNGNIYVTGESDTASGSDFATVAYSSAGALLWAKRYHNPLKTYAEARFVAAGAGGNVYVAGYVGSGKDGTYATIAYSSAGTPVWTNFYSGKPNDVATPHAMAVDAYGNVYVTGQCRGNDGAFDCATVAYSSTGTPLWTNRYNGPGNGNDCARAVAVDDRSHVYVTGYTDTGCATIAYSSAGTALWTNLCNTMSAQAVAGDGNGNVIVVGIDPSGTSLNYSTIAYSGSGLLLWSNRYDGPVGGDDYHPGNSCLAVGPDGGVYVTGASPGTGTGYDYATVKYMPAPDIRFTGLDPLPDAAWRLTLSAPTNIGYRLEASSNLANWLALTNYTNLPVTSIQYTDTLASVFSTRFYRAVWVP
jgi:hypothetical protein